MYHGQWYLVVEGLPQGRVNMVMTVDGNSQPPIVTITDPADASRILDVEEVRAAEAAAMQGRKASVLLEAPLSATMFTGYTKQYLPVLVSAPGHKTGDIVEVTLGAWDGKRCRAEIV